ncbi:MAG: hypothetical protein I4O49_05850 [Janthinobacterium lividum]|nr:hypothetical protein [Janthinobacterium lividum]
MLDNLARNAGTLWIIGALLSCLFLLSYVIWSVFFVPSTREQEESDTTRKHVRKR